MSQGPSIDNRSLTAYYSAHVTSFGSFPFFMDRMWSRLVLLLVLFSVAVASGWLNTQAIADTVRIPGGGFPGRGDYHKWEEANVFYIDGNRLKRAGSYDDAIAKYKRAIAIYSFDPDYYSNLGLAYKKKGDLNSAEEAYRKSNSVSESWSAWANLANLLHNEHRLAESKAAYVRSLECKPPSEDKQLIEQAMSDLVKEIDAGPVK